MRIEMPFTGMGIYALNGMYGAGNVTWLQDGELIVQKIGVNAPNMVIHIPVPGVPTQDDEPIDLFRGYEMPEVISMLSQDIRMIGTRILFYQLLGMVYNSDYACNIIHIELVNPSYATHVMLSQDGFDLNRKYPKSEMEAKLIWPKGGIHFPLTRLSYRLEEEKIVDCVQYQFVTLSTLSRNYSETEELRRKIAQRANEYLFPTKS